LWFTDVSFLAIQATQLTLRANKATNFQSYIDANLILDHKNIFDVAAMLLPKGRKLGQRWLLEAYNALQVGGKFYLAGDNHQGIRPLMNDASSLFGEGTLLGYKKGCRAARFIKNAEQREGQSIQPDFPSWVHEPGITPGTWQEFDANIRGEILRVYSLPGVFSSGGLDEGTNLLLPTIDAGPTEKVLDLGCGCGIIGLTAARIGASQVDLVDANLMAVASARRNAESLGCHNTRVFASDGIDAVRDQKYDQVLTNPPFHTDKSVNYDIANAFIGQAYQVLKPGGHFTLVANKFIPYNLAMEKRFGNLQRIVETNRYHVLRAQKLVNVRGK
jgi:16S rRNA (guanine1207-N2)-methyltransferase